MFGVDRLWQPSVKDYSSGLYAQRWIYTSTVTASTAVVGSNVNDALAIVPADKVRLILGLSIQFVTQGTELVLALTGLLYPAGGGIALATWALARDFPLVATATTVSGISPIDAMAFPGETVQMQATKSGAASLATLTATFWGIEVPRGNIQ